MSLDLASLTLTVNDNLNGTVNWSVSGCGSTQDMALLKAPWNPQAGGRCVWTQVATAVSNGAGVASGLNLSAGGAGFFLWQAVRMATASAADMLSSAVYRPVIDASNVVHSRILDAFVTAIRSLNLSGIGSGADKVLKRWHPQYQTGHDSPSGSFEGGAGAGLPMVIVSPWSKEIDMGYLNATDDIGYPVCVAFFDAADPTLAANIPRNLKWRRQVQAFFHAQQLAGVPEVVLMKCMPEAITSLDWIRQNLLAGALVFNVQSRVVRGLVA